MKLEQTQSKEATADEVLEVMRVKSAEQVTLAFNGQRIIMNGSEWNKILDAAKTGLALQQQQSH